MNKKQLILPIVAAILFVSGLFFMLFVAPNAAKDPSPTVPTTTAPVTTAEPAAEVIVTDPTIPEPTDPPVTEPPLPATVTTSTGDVGLTAAMGFVYDTQLEHLLYMGGDGDEPLCPASLTKLLTAYTVRQFMDPEMVVTVGDEITWIDPGSSRAWIDKGYQLTVEMLIQGMIMPSGNDAAYTLAVAGGRVLAEDPELDRRQAFSLFMDEMNAQARQLGMKNSHFMNPDGIDAEGHYTTMNDLVILSKAVMEDELIMKYAGMAKADVVFASGETITWHNSNYLLHPEFEDFYTPEAIGLKTGSTELAGKCLISVFCQPDGSYLIVGVMGCMDNESRFADTLTLYNLYQ